MRSIPTALANALVAQTAALCTIWQITRTDSTVLRVTDHDRDLVVSGQTYLAALGYSASAIRTLAGLGANNLDIEGILDAAAITDADLRAGRWDHAAVRVSVVDWSNPGGGVLLLRAGWIGQVEISRGSFRAELLGMARAFDGTVGEVYQPTCRASLGDARCGVDLGALTVTGTIDSSSSDRRTLADAARTEAAGYFDFGLLTWTSGANDGLAMEVRASSSGVIELQLPMPYTVASGDAYSLTPGCDGLLATCRDRFDNVVNFRGEPYVPGTDQLMRFGGQ